MRIRYRDANRTRRAHGAPSADTEVCASPDNCFYSFAGSQFSHTTDSVRFHELTGTFVNIKKEQMEKFRRSVSAGDTVNVLTQKPQYEALRKKNEKATYMCEGGVYYVM